MTDPDPVRLCFVCLGNICRSPTAEGVMATLVAEAGLEQRIVVDSAGTGSWHRGELPDSRARAEARRRGVELTSRAATFMPGDALAYDLVLAMDRSNLADLRDRTDPDLQPRLRLLREFDPTLRPDDRWGGEVPDPWSGGDDGFVVVYDLIEGACRGLLDHVRVDLLDAGLPRDTVAVTVQTLREAVGRAVGGRVTAAVAVSGGDVARAGRFVLDDGRSVFAKSVNGPHGMLAAEAAGLSWLRDGLAAGLGLRDGGGPGPTAGEPWPVQVPRVLAVVDDDHDPLASPTEPAAATTDLDPPSPVEARPPSGGEPSLLVLEWVATVPGPADGELLGRGLAALHRSGAAGFGLGRTTWCGPIPQDNRAAPDWATFYGEQRLRPLVRLAVDAGRLDPATAAVVDRVADRMALLAGPPEPPVRLHGDLWSGNVVAGADGRPWLVDPAAHGGHREVDLAMLRLFGGVDERTFAAYAEAHPPADGAAGRVRLWQLAPLLVHAVLFGGGYASAVRACADAYG